MPRAPAIITLPAELRAQIDERLRMTGYTCHRALASWLTEQGHVVGKSAVHRYAVRLRTVDAQMGSVAARLLLTPGDPTRKGKPAKRVAAWQARSAAADAELGRCSQELLDGLDGGEEQLRRTVSRVAERMALLRVSMQLPGDGNAGTMTERQPPA